MSGIFGSAHSNNTIGQFEDFCSVVVQSMIPEESGCLVQYSATAFHRWAISHHHQNSTFDPRNFHPTASVVLAEPAISTPVSMALVDRSDAGLHHPGYFSNQNISVLVDGSIDNCEEISNLLTVSQSSGKPSGLNWNSAELIATAYSQMGKVIFEKLEGSFSICLFDAGSGVVLLARDLFGTRPLYYSNHNGFAFASSIPLLLKLARQNATISKKQAQQFLKGKLEGHHFQLLSGIHEVPVGSVILSKRGKKPETLEFPKHLNSGPQAKNSEDAAAQLRHLLLEAVNRQSMGTEDPGCGAALSSGLDSSSIVWAMRQVNKYPASLNTFTYVAQGPEIQPSWDESPIANDIARQFKAIHHKVYLNATDVPAYLQKIFQDMELPMLGPVAVAQRKLFEMARESGVQTLFGGHGPDLLLAGATGHLGHRLKSELLSAHFLNAFKYINAASRTNQISRKSLLKGAIHALGTTSLNHTILNQVMNSVQPKALWIEAQNAKAVGLQCRYPFLTRDILNFSLSMPDRIRLDDSGRTKPVLRNAMLDILPKTIVGQQGHIGFPVPYHSWLTANKQFMSDLIEQGKLLGLIEPAELEMIWQSALRGNIRHCYEIWRWIGFVGWFVAQGISLE